MTVPTITIFARHSANCPNRHDETYKRCNCRKHLRWFKDGRQFKKSASTRSWADAETVRRKLEKQFEDGEQPTIDDRVSLTRAIEIFLIEKRTENKSDRVVAKYVRELGELLTFMERKAVYTPAGMTKERVLEYRQSWKGAPGTRRIRQVHLRIFLRFCHDEGWLERLPKLSAITVDQAPRLPFTDEQYKAVLDGADPELRRLILLMRHSGLAIGDALALPDIEQDNKGAYRVVTKRQKTGTHVSVLLQSHIAQEILAGRFSKTSLFSPGDSTPFNNALKWQKKFRKLFRRLFGEDTKFSSHCLRDTFAVDLLSKGVPLDLVSKMLGHTSTRITEQAYAPWVKIRQDQADRAIQGTW